MAYTAMFITFINRDSHSLHLRSKRDIYFGMCVWESYTGQDYLESNPVRMYTFLVRNGLWLNENCTIKHSPPTHPHIDADTSPHMHVCMLVYILTYSLYVKVYNIYYIHKLYCICTCNFFLFHVKLYDYL